MSVWYAGTYARRSPIRFILYPVSLTHPPLLSMLLCPRLGYISMRSETGMSVLVSPVSTLSVHLLSSAACDNGTVQTSLLACWGCGCKHPGPRAYPIQVRTGLSSRPLHGVEQRCLYTVCCLPPSPQNEQTRADPLSFSLSLVFFFVSSLSLSLASPNPKLFNLRGLAKAQISGQLSRQ